MTTAGPLNRIRAWFTVQSVGNRLLAGFTVTAALFLIALGMALWGTRRSEVALDQLVFVDAQIAAMLGDVRSASGRARRHEKDFFLVQHELGINEARDRYVTLVRVNLADMRVHLAAIRVVVAPTVRQGNYSALTESTREIDTALAAYEKEFLAAVTAMGKIHSPHVGLLATMRAAALQMETVIVRQGDATLLASLLQVQFAERGTELNGVGRDGPLLVASIAALRRQVASESMATGARDELLALMGRYEAATREYLATDTVVLQHIANAQTASGALEAPMIRAQRAALENQHATNDSARSAIRLGMLVIAITGLAAAFLSALVALLTVRDIKDVYAELTRAKELAETAVRSNAEFAEIEQRSVVADAANQAKSIFLATMSHEIRTPMSGMLGMLELLSLSRLDTEQCTTLETIRESSRSLLRIVDDVLDYSKLEAGQLDIHPDVSSIPGVVRDVARIFASTASSKGLALSSSIDPAISSGVWVDPLRLRQILSNFVSNSIKFTRAGSIEIQAELLRRHQNVEHLRFRVRDTGIGISIENQRKLFQPFQQGDAVAARQAGGTGLGLTISRRLAEMMGGQVEMTSQPGEGTTMVLTLALAVAQTSGDTEGSTTSPPWELSAATAASGNPPALDQAELPRRLVLVVDDHPTNRALLLRQMNTLGHAAETAVDGLDALEKWKTGRFALVITDCEMPEMDGYGLVHAIRTIEACSTESRTPVIACTAHALAGQADKCRAAGMDDCLFKPVSLAGLAKMLAVWLPQGEISRPSGNSVTAACIPQEQNLPLDLRLITETWGSDETTLREVLQVFRQTNDEDAEMLSEGMAGKDLAKVGRASHRMLGASKMIGAHSFTAAVEAIEQANRRGDWDQLAAAMEEFEEQFAILRAYIDSAYASMA